MRFSVVIPTWNRCDVLGRTLDALLSQSGAPSFEALVVDDGSTDGTARTVIRRQQHSEIPLHYFHQSNRKQGAARNLGVRHAEGDWILFLGDDIIPTPTFLAEHFAAHCRHDPNPETSRTTVVGYTTWPPHVTRTRFLEYIGEQGWQFGYSIIEDPLDLPFNFFYTSNLSLSRRRFLESGGFDESFREYGWEDIELSYRLKAAGMRLVYAAAAVAHHDHPTDLQSFSRRQRQVGRSAWSFHKRQPAVAEFLGLDRIPVYRRRDHWRAGFLTWLCRLTEHRHWPDLSRFYPDLMSYYYFCGVAEGKDTDTSRGR